MNSPQLKPFREHAMRSLYMTKWLNIWEGSVRCGKTIISILAWLCFIEESKGKFFLMSGNTLNSLRRNVIDGEFGLLALSPGSNYISSRHELHIPTSQGTKVCYCFGGGDQDSADSLRGLTVSGWYADEVTRHHDIFITEAFNRTLADPGRKVFWTLNPDNPDSEIYEKHIDKWRFATAEERKDAGGVNYYHFTLEDNPIYSTDDIKKISSQYSGFEYDRYILGKRVVAEGLIYPGIAQRPWVFQDLNPSTIYARYAAIDFGTDHPNVIYLGGPYIESNGVRNPKRWGIVREDYDTNRDKDTNDIIRAYERTCASVMVDPHEVQIAIDPSARVLRNAFIRKGYAAIVNARNEVDEGIRFLKDCLYNGYLILDKTCTGVKREFGVYSWNPKPAEKGKEEPIKSSDDGCDALRYFAMTHMRPYL